jgi:hypothetical protein
VGENSTPEFDVFVEGIGAEHRSAIRGSGINPTFTILPFHFQTKNVARDFLRVMAAQSAEASRKT